MTEFIWRVQICVFLKKFIIYSSISFKNHLNRNGQEKSNIKRLLVRESKIKDHAMGKVYDCWKSKFTKNYFKPETLRNDQKKRIEKIIRTSKRKISNQKTIEINSKKLIFRIESQTSRIISSQGNKKSIKK